MARTASAATIKTIGDWRANMIVPLRDAMETTAQYFGKTAYDTCKYAVFLMARSAAKSTRKASANRPVLTDRFKNKYVVVRPWDGQDNRLYQFKYKDPEQWRLTATWEQAKKIAHRGLAKDSWMWQLGGKGGVKGGSNVIRWKNRNATAGVIKQNKLSYVLKVIAGGWEKTAERAAIKGIMAKVAKSYEARLKRELERKR